MRALRVVGLGEDGKTVILEDPMRGERFHLPADERLRAAARGDVTRLGQIDIELESQMRPREIQARIRAGESVAQVAEASGLPEDKVERFAYPVLLERSRTADLAQRAHPVREDGPDVQTLGEVCAHAFGVRGQEYSEAVWDSWKNEENKWVVQLRWTAGRSDNHAHWSFHPGAHGGTVTPLDDHAHDLLDPNPSRSLRTVRPVTELARQALAVEAQQRPQPAAQEPVHAEPTQHVPGQGYQAAGQGQGHQASGQGYQAPVQATAAGQGHQVSAQHAPGQGHPGPAQPASTQPASTQPASTQPASTQPASTQPASTQPASTQPASTQQGSAEQGSAYQGSAQQGSVYQGSTQHGSTQQGSVQQGSAYQDQDHQAQAHGQASAQQASAYQGRDQAPDQQASTHLTQGHEAQDQAPAQGYQGQAPAYEAAQGQASAAQDQQPAQATRGQASEAQSQATHQDQQAQAQQPDPGQAPAAKAGQKPDQAPAPDSQPVAEQPQPATKPVQEELVPEPKPDAAKEKPAPRRGKKKNHPVVPAWEDVLLGVRSNRG